PPGKADSVILRLAELLPVQLLERVLLRPGGVLVHQKWRQRRPPSVVLRVELLDHLPVLARPPGLVAWVRAPGAQLPPLLRLAVRSQVPARRADAALAVLVIVHLRPLRPAADVGEQGALGPIRLRVLEQRHEAPALDLPLDLVGQLRPRQVG